MIEDSLLFQMGYILPHIGLLEGGILFVLILFIFLGYRISKPTPRENNSITLPELPKVDESDFEERIADYIRSYFAKKYAPLRARAHTAKEITKYAGSHKYLPILLKLERVEYTSKRLSLEERKELLKGVR